MLEPWGWLVFTFTRINVDRLATAVLWYLGGLNKNLGEN